MPKSTIRICVATIMAVVALSASKWSPSATMMLAAGKAMMEFDGGSLGLPSSREVFETVLLAATPFMLVLAFLCRIRGPALFQSSAAASLAAMLVIAALSGRSCTRGDFACRDVCGACACDLCRGFGLAFLAGSGQPVTSPASTLILFAALS